MPSSYSTLVYKKKMLKTLGNKTSHFGKALLNKAPNKGGKGRAKKENPKSKPKAQKPKVGRKGQRNKLCSKAPPTNHKKHIKEGNEKFERVGSIEEPSLAMGNAPQIEMSKF